LKCDFSNDTPNSVCCNPCKAGQICIHTGECKTGPGQPCKSSSECISPLVCDQNNECSD
jgi:hypothetical protein